MWEKMLNRLSLLILALTFGFSVVYALMSSLNLDFPRYAIVLMISGCLSVLTLIFLNRTTRLISLASVVLSVSAVLLLNGAGKVANSVYSFGMDYFLWLYNYIYNGEETVRLFVTVTAAGLCVIVSAYVFVFIYKKFLFFLLLIPGVALFTVQWSFDYVTTLVPFYVFLLSILLCYIRHVHVKRTDTAENEHTKDALLLVWALPVCLAVILLASSVKAGDKPIEWAWMDEKVNSVYNYFSNRPLIAKYDYFSVASTGFGNQSGVLGGRVSPDQTLVLTVETDRNVYLKGGVYDTYTGNRWQIGASDLSDPGLNNELLYPDTLEMLSGMPLLTENANYLSDHFYKTTIGVIFQNMETKSIFLPVKIISFTLNKPGLELQLDSNGSLTSSQRQKRGFSYSMEAYVPKLGQPELADALRHSERNLYVRAIRRNRETVFRYQALNKNAGEIYAKYLQLPDTIPQRVADLARYLSRPYSNRYDKVRALEGYLSSTFPYSLDVPETPPGKDFVDYFLFDLGKGYCTYYASALTILARCVGIPARYVEGYILPPKASEENGNLYFVTNGQAHAWTEVYFEGYGWLPFEATAPFREDFYSNPDESVATGNTSHDDLIDDLLEMMEDYDLIEDAEPGTGGAAADKPSSLPYPVVLPGIAILAVCAVLLFNRLKAVIKLYKIRKLPPKESVIAMYKYYIGMLASQRFGIHTDETPAQYAQRIDGIMYFRPLRFGAVSDIFMKARYSADEISDGEKRVMYDFYRSMQSESRNNLGKFKYFILRNVLGRL